MTKKCKKIIKLNVDFNRISSQIIPTRNREIYCFHNSTSDENTFDFAMSVGVLHHIPDTVSAMKKCVEKIKKGGYFYAYLYYDLEDRGQLFKVAFHLSTLLRKIVSSLPSGLKKIVCDVLAALIYFPLSRIAGLLTKLNLEKLGRRLPLSAYQDKTFNILRNDALDRFGTKLEQRFSRK